MADDNHYVELEDNFKSRKFNLQSLLDSIGEEDEGSFLYPALDSLKNSKERYSKFCFVAEGGEKRIEAAFDCIAQREIAFATPRDKTPSFMERFIKEARLMAYLEHPNIMPVYDIGMNEDFPYLTMELIHGDNLAKKRGKEKISREGLDEFLEVFIRVCDAVSFAHSKGVAHLDIKPHNIQIGQFGEVLLCDWGLSKTIGAFEGFEIPEELDISMTADLTIRGVLRGTPGYMSPSLSQGNPGSFQDDVYALGATLYFILCGQCPHYSKDVKEILANTLINEPAFPSSVQPLFEIPQSIEAVALKALSKEGYKTAQDLKQEILNHQRGYATKAEEAGFLTILKLLYKRQKILCNTILASVFLLFAITAFFINSIQEEKEKELQARLEAEDAQIKAESSLKMYKSELRYNRYLMDGIDLSLKKIISEVQKKNIPLDIQKVLVKVGRGNLNGEAYEAAAQMLETLAANSSGEAKKDAIHDLIFTKIFMHDFKEALSLLSTLSQEELERADIFEFISICEEYENKPMTKGVLTINDFREIVMKVNAHERDRLWFLKHAFNCYLRKCHTDKEVLALYDVILDLKDPEREFSLKIKNDGGQKTLYFKNAQKLKAIHMPQILDGLHIDKLDLRGTGLTSLVFARELSVKEINIVGTAIENLRPLSYIEGIKKVIVSDLNKVKWWRQLEERGIEVTPLN